MTSRQPTCAITASSVSDHVPRTSHTSRKYTQNYELTHWKIHALVARGSTILAEHQAGKRNFSQGGLIRGRDGLSI
jgi:hypothetical protein